MYYYYVKFICHNFLLVVRPIYAEHISYERSINYETRLIQGLFKWHTYRTYKFFGNTNEKEKVMSLFFVLICMNINKYCHIVFKNCIILLMIYYILLIVLWLKQYIGVICDYFFFKFQKHISHHNVAVDPHQLPMKQLKFHKLQLMSQ